MEDFSNFGNTINNAFFFVVDIIINLQSFFIQQAKNIGKIVLLIAILSAALNYALTGSGLKENIIKITKATLFFLIVIFAYPSIVGFISSFTFKLAEGSVYEPVKSYMNQTINTVSWGHSIVLHGTPNDEDRSLDRIELLTHIARDKNNLLDGLLTTRTTDKMTYSAVAPASVIKILFFMAGECFNYADGKTHKLQVLPEFGRVLKGLICGFFIIFTGAFALLEYLVCFLEFMLVASVGIILFPLSIWEGTKFAAEKFIGAMLGFFIKLLLCNVAIFLLIYGFVSLFRIMSKSGFSGAVDQMIFILFVCLLFLFICKSAPAIAQSLLTGSPSLSGTGAISAVAGAVGAAVAVGKMGGAVLDKGKQAAGAIAGGGIDMVGGIIGAGAATGAVRDAGGSGKQQAGAFFSSLKNDVGDKFAAGGHLLARSLFNSSGSRNNIGNGGMPGAVSEGRLWSHDLKDRLNSGSETPFKDHFDARKQEGAKRGKDYAKKIGLP